MLGNILHNYDGYKCMNIRRILLCKDMMDVHTYIHNYIQTQSGHASRLDALLNSLAIIVLHGTMMPWCAFVHGEYDFNYVHY